MQNPRPRSGGPWGLTLLALLATVAVAFVTNDRTLPVTLPLLAVLWVGILFYASLRGTAGVASVEVGSVYAAVVMLYAVYPLVGYLANGLTYGIGNENRLYRYLPTPQEIGRTAWLYVGHLTVFSIGYRLVRGRVRFQPQLRSVGRVRVQILLVLLASIAGYLLVLGKIYDLSASDYAGSYLILSRLPLLVAQITNHLGGMRLILEVALLVVLFTRFKRFRWLIVVLLAGVGFSTFQRLWSRTEFVLLAAAVVMLFHWLVRPVSERLIALAGATIVALFIVAGVLRGGLLESRYSAGWNVFAYSSEFESLLGNAYELDRLNREGAIGSLSAGFYLTDVLALVPQQLSPVPKVSPADWYVNRFYPESAEAGLGLAFGTIPESILAGGIPDLLLRGALLGALLAAVHRWVSTRGRAAFWPLVIYTWMTIQVYNCFRNTTFCLLGLFFWRVLPIVVVVEVLVALKKGRRERTVGRLAEAPS